MVVVLLLVVDLSEGEDDGEGNVMNVDDGSMAVLDAASVVVVPSLGPFEEELSVGVGSRMAGVVVVAVADGSASSVFCEVVEVAVGTEVMVVLVALETEEVG